MDEKNNLRIRIAVLSDASQLTPMRHALWPESSPSYHAAELTAVLNGTSQRVYPLTIFVAEESDGTLIGFLEANLRSAADGCDEKLPVGYVEGWFVAELHRSKGVGAALLRAAEDWRKVATRRPLTPTSKTNSPSTCMKLPDSASQLAPSSIENRFDVALKTGETAHETQLPQTLLTFHFCPVFLRIIVEPLPQREPHQKL
jgi:GNAT superfamily N-acetyltransferase